MEIYFVPHSAACDEAGFLLSRLRRSHRRYTVGFKRGFQVRSILDLTVEATSVPWTA